MKQAANPSPFSILAFGILVLAVTTLGGCKTPEEVALKRRQDIFVAGQDQAGAKPAPTTKSAPTSGSPYTGTPGWNPTTSISGSIGDSLSYSRVGVAEPFVAMTFDDGPHPVNTPRLLDMLKARNIKATFYVVGPNARRYPHLLQRMIAEGHEIGNHTETHGNLTNMGTEGVRRELSLCHQAIVQATGVPPRTVRPPYGAITANQKAWIKQEFGYPCIMWAVDPEDWKRPGSSVVANRIVSGARNGSIILAHDIHSPTIDAMPSALDRLLGKGYRFVTVTQLIALENKGS